MSTQRLLLSVFILVLRLGGWSREKGAVGSVLLCSEHGNARVCKQSIAGGWKREKAEGEAGVRMRVMTMRMGTLYVEALQAFIHSTILQVTATLLSLLVWFFVWVLLFFPPHFVSSS